MGQIKNVSNLGLTVATGPSTSATVLPSQTVTVSDALATSYALNSREWQLVTTPSSYTASPGDVVLADGTDGAFTVYLPVVAFGGIVWVKKTDSSTNAITVEVNLADQALTTPPTIDGASSYVLSVQNESCQLVSDGAEWRVVTPSGVPGFDDFVVNVLSYGADPTGVKDSTAAIQAALNACASNGGGIVGIPPGTFLVNSTAGTATPSGYHAESYALLLTDKTAIVGSGPESIILCPYPANGSNNAAIIDPGGLEYIGVRNVQLRSTATDSGNGEGFGIVLTSSTHIDICDNLIYGFASKGVQQLGNVVPTDVRICRNRLIYNQNHVGAQYLTDFWIEDNYCGAGNTVGGSGAESMIFDAQLTRGSISGNIVDGWGDIRWTDATDVAVTGNVVLGTANANAGLAGSGGTCINVTISGNVSLAGGGSSVIGSNTQGVWQNCVIEGNFTDDLIELLGNSSGSNTGIVIADNVAAQINLVGYQPSYPLSGVAVTGNVVNAVGGGGGLGLQNMTGVTVVSNQVLGDGGNGSTAAAVNFQDVTGLRSVGNLYSTTETNAVYFDTVDHFSSIADRYVTGTAPAAGSQSIFSSSTTNGNFVGCDFSGVTLGSSAFVVEGFDTTTHFENCDFSGASLADLQVSSSFRHCQGVNPVGEVTVTVPSSGTAVAAAVYDQTFYITNGTASSTFAISGGPTITLPASAFGTIHLPAGQTLTPTYTSAPTWVVEGE